MNEMNPQHDALQAAHPSAPAADALAPTGGAIPSGTNPPASATATSPTTAANEAPTVDAHAASDSKGSEAPSNQAPDSSNTGDAAVNTEAPDASDSEESSAVIATRAPRTAATTPPHDLPSLLDSLQDFPATDDILGWTLPLLEQVATLHAANQVAPLNGLNEVKFAFGQLWFEADHGRAPQLNMEAVERIDATTTLEIAGRWYAADSQSPAQSPVQASLLDLTVKSTDEAAEKIETPVYVPGYVSWEHFVQHHDPLSDVFVLGLVLASLACRLNFSDADDMRHFAASRRNLFALNPRLHPVLARMIVRMTELSRRRRLPDLQEVIHSLKNYRHLDASGDVGSTLATDSSAQSREQRIQAHLRDRLFDMSRRNRLLYFKSSQQSVNLTVASFPLLLDVNNIKPTQLFYWHDEVAQTLAAEKPIALQKYLRFEDAPYLKPQLDAIRATAQRDQAEFGFSQLRLVLCMLRWHHLKEEKDERIHSPLLLLPVSLQRKKGVRDTYVLQPESGIAEVNPALRHALSQTYGIELPETFDLEHNSLDSLHEHLERSIRASEPGITLHKVTQPRVELVRQQARQRVDQFQRRQRKGLSGSAVRNLAHYQYSYDPANYHPLGVQIFLDRVKPLPAPLSHLVGAPRPRVPMMSGEPATTPEQAAPDGKGGEKTIERETYRVQDESTGSPYDWEFDLCALTLGNFNYRKMSLVRDYSAILHESVSSPSFERIFSTAPRASFGSADASLPLAEQYTVVAQDPTQARAVARARAGESMIIQGPPGTGKSQTITNLIADYAARGKRVLFVCEKRAAIDVVYFRLQQQGLDRLCALIHDSQADKKAFVKDLKECYESWLAAADDAQAHTRARQELLEAMRREIHLLEEFSGGMTTSPAVAGVRMVDLYLRVAELRAGSAPSANTALDADSREQLPAYTDWQAHAGVYRDLLQYLAEIGAPPRLAEHPVRYLAPSVLKADSPVRTAREQVALLLPMLQELRAMLAPVPAHLWSSCGNLFELAAYLRSIDPLLKRGLTRLLDAKSTEAKKFNTALKNHQKAEKAFEAARQAAAGWTQPPSKQDLDTLLREAPGLEAGVLRFLKPGWWRLRSYFAAHYDMNRHQIKPRWSECLRWLQEQYSCAQTLEQSAAQIEEEWQVSDVAEFVAQLEPLRQREALPARLLALQRQLADNTGPDGALLERIAAKVEAANEVLNQTLSGIEGLPLDTLIAELSAMEADLGWLPQLTERLQRLHALPTALARAIRDLPLPIDALELAIAEQSIARVYRDNAALSKHTSAHLDAICSRLASAMREQQKLNALAVLETLRNRFVDHIALSNRPVGGMDAEQKQFKKHYGAGRREVENEFSKVMRFKAIRELAGGDSGLVVRDLKPVWLMSPLSISDTLPLEQGYFDVVIFDEASQIPVEEAVPSLYRGPQVIVVGDEMQLPPTNFFSAREDNAGEDNENEDLVADLESDSFLVQAARNLPSTMLGWHYRSRSEALIAFSNQRFYDGALLTIPDHRLPAESRPIEIAAGTQEVALDAALARPISFHFLEGAVYADRRNAAEAAYIARMVRDLLRAGSRLSIGVIAFSEAQQGEIESALKELASQDGEFSTLLDAAYEREDDGQFCGLFVKNLENVQGDERDLIILSICYGYDRERKMLMNFGPINKAGGEKRLNVVFSRAKRHMVLVSGIKYQDIRNEYNPGAFVFRSYLQYAELHSRGDWKNASHVLGLLAAKRNQRATRAVHPVAQQLGAALEKHGYSIDFNIGQSSLCCNLGVRRPGDDRYSLGILIDTEDHYANPDLLERYLQQPELMRNFDWRIARVLTKDWAENREQVVQELLKTMQLPVVTSDLASDMAPDIAPMAEKPAEPAPVFPASTVSSVSPEPPPATPPSQT